MNCVYELLLVWVVAFTIIFIIVKNGLESYESGKTDINYFFL